MLLINVRIRNFRTISDELAFEVANNTRALIGPNNSGKTNILRAITLFFCLHPHATTTPLLRYSKKDDFPKFVDSGRTTIQMIFKSQNTEADKEALDLYEDIKHILHIPATIKGAIHILLSFSDTGRPTYQLFPSAKRPTSQTEIDNYTLVQDEFFLKFFGNFAVHYIQSDKRFVEIYDSLLLPSVKQAISESLSGVYETVKVGIHSINADINKYMNEIGLSTFAIRLSEPDNVTDLIKDIEFRLKDEIESELISKGMGIQALAMMSSMLWLQEFYRRNGRSVLWLIEEPESFLHPSLLIFQLKILNRLSEEATVIYATHALGLVPHDAKLIVGIEKNDKRSGIRAYRNTNEATRDLRSLLGVRFGDFYNLPEAAIAVEGPTDRQYLEWFLSAYHIGIAPEDHFWPFLRSATILDYGGVGALQFFIQSSYDFIRRETPYVALFDSDDAGTRARQNLQRYFQEKRIGYEFDLDFVSVRRGYSIEGMFSDEILREIFNEHNHLLVDGYSEDVEGTVEPFRIHDKKKTAAFRLLTERAQIEDAFGWARRFTMLCAALDKALSRQHERLAKWDYGSPIYTGWRGQPPAGETGADVDLGLGQKPVSRTASSPAASGEGVHGSIDE